MSESPHYQCRMCDAECYLFEQSADGWTEMEPVPEEERDMILYGTHLGYCPACSEVQKTQQQELF